MESIIASGAIGAILVAVAAIFRERNMRRKHKTERYQSDFQIGQRLRDELRAEMDRREQEYQSDRKELETRITALEKDVERCHEERRELQALVKSLTTPPAAKKPAAKKPAAKKPAAKRKHPPPGILN